MSSPIVSLKQQLSGLKITNCTKHNLVCYNAVIFLFIYLFIFSIWVFFHMTFKIHRTAGAGGIFSSSLTLPPASRTLTHQPDNYWRELTSAHSQWPDSNLEPLVSERKSLTTKLCTLNRCSYYRDNQIKPYPLSGIKIGVDKVW